MSGPQHRAGLLLALAPVPGVVGRRGVPPEDARLAVAHMPLGRGEAMILGATLLWAVEVVVARRLLGSWSSWTVGLARMVLGSLLLIGWLAVRGRVHLFATLDARQWTWIALTGVVLAPYVATWFAALARAQAVD